MDQHSPPSRPLVVFVALLFLALLCAFPLFAAPSAPKEAVPVWLYDAPSYEFWRDPHGHYQGFYPQLIQAINQKYGYNLQIQPIGGNEISQSFNNMLA